MFAPGHEIFVLSDVDVPGVSRIPLKSTWPGWWAKMELFRPDIDGDLLYFDLDTAVVSSVVNLTRLTRVALLRDFYRDGKRRPEGLGSGVMFLPESDRRDVWAQWSPDLIAKYKPHGLGDQAFLESLWMDKADRLQDVAPNEIFSYKVHVRGVGVPPTASVICYHGQPRPWTEEGRKWLR